MLNHRKEEKEVLKQCLVAEGIVDKIFLALIDWGVAYHHSGLGRDERKLIEDAFRYMLTLLILCNSWCTFKFKFQVRRFKCYLLYINTCRWCESTSSKSDIKSPYGRQGLYFTFFI